MRYGVPPRYSFSSPSALYLGSHFPAKTLVRQCLSHYDPRTDCMVTKIYDIIINKAEAPRRNSLANSLRCIGAVNSIDRSTKVHRTRAHWIAGPASHKPGEIRLPLNHLVWRMPIRPLSLARYLEKALPSEALAANTYAIAQGAGFALN